MGRQKKKRRNVLKQRQVVNSVEEEEETKIFSNGIQTIVHSCSCHSSLSLSLFDS